MHNTNKTQTGLAGANLTDQNWKVVEPILAEDSTKKLRGPQTRPDRVVFQAILDHMLSDVPLRLMRAKGSGKSKLPSHDTLATRAKGWKKSGVLAKAAAAFFGALDDKELTRWINRVRVLDASGKSWPDWLLVMRDAANADAAQRNSN